MSSYSTHQRLPSLPATYTTRSIWKVAKAPTAQNQARSRKGPKARSWTEEEENVLLDGRERRIPYRRLAFELGKTELACRLHYHQLTVVKTRQVHDAYMRATPRQSTSPPTQYPHSPEITNPSTAGSPISQQRTLPSINRWFDDSDHHRSSSLPTPTGSRCSSPQCEHDGPRPWAIVTPPTPPSSHLLSPFVPARSSLIHPSLGGHHRTCSYPPPKIRIGGLSCPPQYFGNGAAEWRPRPTRSMSISSNERDILALSPPLCGTGISSSPNSDRCSVQSLLNHGD
ncbi:uncharacterized protein HMPREF1541_07222 [Cyphellophora europaea CBS 101466]|uniref:Myb-like domain-containing protein n=1 Tax=Cyphellophora europaea (strain CBS 101466) TaxID=1220924 RepID=W2RMP4_CYPE1|nr:uncharacterized protein HMPREF1541_07222 [Cyphellophora europaea CBS 101466]ETN37600.1 hypothetical protein HMPREF1541_07222 [Cyphellophora europaea CBS 101466]